VGRAGLGQTGLSNSSLPQPPQNYDEGPHPLISDSLFSLIIFIYVTITFLYIFYAFCWRAEVPKPMPDGRELPMITEMLEQAEQGSTSKLGKAGQKEEV